jgi:hypothetical protein
MCLPFTLSLCVRSSARVGAHQQVTGSRASSRFRRRPVLVAFEVAFARVWVLFAAAAGPVRSTFFARHRRFGVRSSCGRRCGLLGRYRPGLTATGSTRQQKTECIGAKRESQRLEVVCV